MSTFGNWLQSCRRGPRRVIDQAIGMSDGYVSQLERGRIKPPDTSVCARLDAALGLPQGTCWNQAAPQRMREYDPDLYAWHLSQLNTPADIDAGLLERLATLDPDAQHAVKRLLASLPVGMEAATLAAATDLLVMVGRTK